MIETSLPFGRLYGKILMQVKRRTHLPHQSSWLHAGNSIESEIWHGKRQHQLDVSMPTRTIQIQDSIGVLKDLTDNDDVSKWESLYKLSG